MKNGNWRVNVSPSTRNEYRRKWFKKVKSEVLVLLGGKCVRCGYDDIRALEVDHINGDGKFDRHRTGTSLYYFYRKNIGSGRFQVLCANCNCIKRAENQECPLRDRDGPNKDQKATMNEDYSKIKLPMTVSPDSFPDVLVTLISRADKSGLTLVVLPKGASWFLPGGEAWTPDPPPDRADGAPSYSVLCFEGAISGKPSVYGSGRTIEEAAKALMAAVEAFCVKG